MFGTKLPLTGIHSSISVSSHSEAMRQILPPLALKVVPISEADLTDARKHIVFPITVVARAVSQE